LDAPQALRAEAENPLGHVAVIGPFERAVRSNPGLWTQIPGLSTGIWSRAGDALEITVSGESFDAQNLWLRAVVDGVVASPSFVRFRTTADTRGGSRSFTFVHTNVGAGQHIVEVQWFSSPGTSAQLRDRALTVLSAAPGSGTARLAVAAGTSEVAAAVSSWAPVSNMNTSLTLDQPSRLAVTFSADAVADSGRFFARAVVDGVVLSDVLFAESLAPRAPRAYTFVLDGVAAGAHSVRIDWHGEGGTLRVGPRTLSVVSAPTALAADGGMAAAGFQLAPFTVTSSTYVDLPSSSTTFDTSAASSSAIVTVGAEVRMNGAGRFFLQPIIDGRRAQPGDVEFLQGESRWRAASFSFALKNLAPGTHNFKVQVAVDPGSTGFVGDRFFRLVHRRRSGSEFVQPLLHPAGIYTQTPRQGTFKHLVICFDPVRPAHPAPSFWPLYFMHEGSDGGPSLMGYFAENSGGRMARSTLIAYNNCLDGAWSQAPPAHQGDWYWNNNAWDVMFKEALQAADPSVDFHALDLNRDNALTPDEVVIELVHPQNVPDGFVRGTSVALDGIATPMSVTFMQFYVSPDPARRRENVGIVSHELSHLVFRAEDLYGCPTTSQPGQHSMMATRHVTHLDPWHKLHAGLIVPDALEVGALSDRSVDLRPVSAGREVVLLYDRNRGDREYFLIEYREPSLAPHDDPAAGGVVVWHVFDDANLALQFPPQGGASCGWDRLSVRKVAVLDFLGEAVDLTWANGTPAGVRATRGARGFDTMELQLTRP
jgi:M6 family metalloprotease-like protein